MSGISIHTYCNPEQVKPLLELAKKILDVPDYKLESTKMDDKPYLTKTLNELLRAGHQLHFVRFLDKEYVFKVFADLGNRSVKHYSIGRRLSFFVHNWLYNPAYKSYQGATRLKRLDIPTIEPVACLVGHYGLQRRGIFIYESLDSEHNLKTWLATDMDETKKDETIKQLANITKKLERSEYTFGDFKLGNILITKNHAEGFKLNLIDTDEVRKSAIKRVKWPKFIQPLVKLWQLRRLKPDEDSSKEFLRQHFSKSDIENEYKIWSLIRNLRLNPVKYVKRKLENEQRK